MLMPENGPVPIGELARRTGVAASALRYYERIGLLPPAERAGQRRHYPPSIAERVALIRLCQDAGFTLAEIGRLLASSSSRPRQAWDRMAERKIAELDARIADAQRAKKLLTHALECPHPDLLACPNFRSALEAQLESPLRAMVLLLRLGTDFHRTTPCPQHQQPLTIAQSLP
jgi:DNA-binding transcriptional MerR regulator